MCGSLYLKLRSGLLIQIEKVCRTLMMMEISSMLLGMGIMRAEQSWHSTPYTTLNET
jgi:hypothetical protein